MIPYEPLFNTAHFQEIKAGKSRNGTNPLAIRWFETVAPQAKYLRARAGSSVMSVTQRCVCDHEASQNRIGYPAGRSY